MDNPITITDLRQNYPNVLSAAVIGQFLGKDPQRVRNMAKSGRYPFAIVEKGRHRDNYTFPTERFIAWVEGRL